MTRDERLPDRFWNKVTENEDTGCWEWTGARNKGGYSRFNWPTRTDSVYGHRLAYETLVGPIADGLHIDHLCRVRHCVNPAHMEAVTCRVNLLRGDAPCAKHAVKTHCPRGHAYEGENLRLYRNRKGSVLRMCRECGRIHNRTHYARARAAARARDAA